MSRCSWPRSGPPSPMRSCPLARRRKVLTNETIPKDTKDLAPLLGELKALAPDQVVTLLSGSTAPFFRAYEQSGWSVPVTGRIDLPVAAGALSPEFLASGGLDGATSITVF